MPGSKARATGGPGEDYVGTCLNALVEMLFMEHQVTKPQLQGVGGGGRRYGV